MINSNRLFEVQTHVMLTSHMQNVLPVFINEDTWQQIGEEDREAIQGALDDLAQETLKMAQESEAELISTLEGHGMTFITEEDGLKIDEFRKGVEAQVSQDFPTWPPYMERIRAIE